MPIFKQKYRLSASRAFTQAYGENKKGLDLSIKV